MKNSSDRICILRHGYYPEDPRVFKEVCALYEAGFSVDVICLKRQGEKYNEIVDGVRVYRLPHRHVRGSIFRYIFEYGLSFILFGLVLTFLYFIRRFASIQVNTLPDALVFVTMIPHFFGAKIILDMHEPTPELWLTKYGTNKFTFLYKIQILLEQRAIKYADKVITVNESLRSRFIERGAEGDKIKVVRNVPIDIFGKSQNYNKSNSVFTLICHGTIEKRYGQELILRALPFIRTQIENIRLYIVGSGENSEQLYNLCKKLNCSDIVTFSGFVPYTQIADMISLADIGLVPLEPSPFAELCQPNKLFEYVTLKKPVICSNLEAIKESFDESCVMFFEPWEPRILANCIIDLYRNPDRRKNMVKNAYLSFQEINWSKTKRNYLEIIRNMNGKSTE